MRRMISVWILAVLFISSVAAAERVEIGNPQTVGTDLSVTVLESNQFRTVVRYEIGAFGKESVEIDGSTFHKITLGREIVEKTLGHPELPIINRSIMIPDNAEVHLNVISSEYTDIPHIPVVPSKGPIRVGTNPDDIPYVFEDVYRSSVWYPQDLAVLSEPYSIRRLRGVTIGLHPFQYLSESATMRVYTSVTLEVVSSGKGISPFSRLRSVPEFSYIYKNLFINYEPEASVALAKVSSTTEDEMAEMLVIAYDDFADEMAEFVEWKNQKGIKTTMVGVVEACGGDVNSSNIKAFIQDYYDGNNNLTYVLLVGDADQVPPYTYGAGGSSISDYWYSLLTINDTNDVYPDIIVGRFSAETSDHVLTQVRRSVDYEKDPQGQDWFRKGSGVADEYNDKYHMMDVRDTLLVKYDSIDELYDTDMPSYELRNQFAEAINNEGRGVVNYAGHGSETGWNVGITAAQFNDNQGMLPFITSVACLPGDFDYSQPCFGEALLRKQDGNDDPIGAIGAYMSSIWQYDYAFKAQMGFCQALKDDDVRKSYGGLCYYGAVQMINAYPNAGYMHAMGWVIFGDPSLQVRTGNPTPIYAVHSGTTDYDATSYTVTVKSDDGADTAIVGARCGLYQSGVMYGSAFTDANGVAQIVINETILTGGPLVLTVTGFNTATLQNDVEVYYSDLVVTTIALPATTKYCQPNPNPSEPDGYLVTCHAYSEFNLTWGYPRLWYEVNGGGWLYIEMDATGEPSEYDESIPYQQPGDEISYKIEARDMGGGSYTTEVFSFSVIDYGLVLWLDDEYTKSEQYNHTVTFDFTVTNDGVAPDIYDLTAVSDLGWQVEILDTNNDPIIPPVTPQLGMDVSYSFRVRVLVESGIEGDLDEITVTATSTESSDIPPPSESMICRAESEGVPLSIPFVEFFPDENLDVTNWQDNCRINISDDALYVENGSPVYSVLIQYSPMAPPECFESDKYLTSKCVDLGDQSYAHVGFWYERTGSGDSPEAGDDLIVEYLNDAEEWVLLFAVPGEGDDMTDFGNSYYLAVPEDGLHRHFKVRFYSEHAWQSGQDPANPLEERDTWFVDDITIVHPTLLVTTEPLADSKYCQLSPNPEEPAGYLVYGKVYADNPLASGYPRLWYEVNGGGWQYIEMTATGEPHEYSQSIPYQQAGDDISYKIEAEDIEANSSTTDVFSFQVDDYGLTLCLDDDTLKSEFCDCSVDFLLSVTNGCSEDAFELAGASNYFWEVKFYDMLDTEIQTTPLLNPGQDYSFKARVTVGSEHEGVSSTITATATSTLSADPKPDASINFQVTSKGQVAPFPFVEAFPNVELDLGKWNWNSAIEITGDADNEPSEPLSLHLRYHMMEFAKLSSGPTGHDATSLVSDFIDISDCQSDVVVSYAFEQGGPLDDPESGDDLIMEYIDPDGFWHVLSRQYGSGPSTSEFTVIHCTPIPEAHKHNRFRIHIYILSEADPGDPDERDDWFVDNITVSFAIPASPPTLIDPPDGTQSENAQPLLQWSSQETAIYYEVIIDDDTDFSSPHASAVLDGTSWQVTPALSNGTYYWKVRSSADSLNWTDWSTPWTYTMGLCNCGAKADLNNDGTGNPLDVTILVNYVYRQLDGRVYPEGWNCPYDLGDLDCDGSINPIDVTFIVNYVYLQVDNICDGCNPE